MDWLDPSIQDSGHIESHTFATSSLTQFCILFKRTFITICRDQVSIITHDRSICWGFITDPFQLKWFVQFRNVENTRLSSAWWGLLVSKIGLKMQVEGWISSIVFVGLGWVQRNTMARENNWTGQAGLHTLINSLLLPGPDPSQTDVPRRHRGADRPALPEHWQRCQQGLQQHWIPLLLHAVHHVWSAHAHCVNL